MSGGSLNYLYCKDIEDSLIEYIPEIEEVERYLLEKGYDDVSMDVRRLIEYLKTSYNRIYVLNKQLKPIFRAVELKMSADLGDDGVIRAIRKYRGEEE